jgi:hypothetical protein
VKLTARFALTAVAGFLTASAAFAQASAPQPASAPGLSPVAVPVAAPAAPTAAHPQPLGFRTAAGPLDPAMVARVRGLEKAWDKYDTDRAAGDKAALAVDESTIFAAYLEFHDERAAFRKAHPPAAASAASMPASNVPQ